MFTVIRQTANMWLSGQNNFFYKTVRFFINHIDHRVMLFRMTIGTYKNIILCYCQTLRCHSGTHGRHITFTGKKGLCCFQTGNNIGSIFPLFFPVFKGKCHQLFFLGKHLDLSTKRIVSRFLIGGFPLGGRLISASVYKGICQIRSHNDQNHDQDPEPENAVSPFHLFLHLSALLPQ